MSIDAKEQQRRLLDEQCRRFTEEQGGEVVTYAGQSKPDRKPWKRKPTSTELAFQKELQERGANSSTDPSRIDQVDR